MKTSTMSINRKSAIPHAVYTAMVRRFCITVTTGYFLYGNALPDRPLRQGSLLSEEMSISLDGGSYPSN